MAGASGGCQGEADEQAGRGARETAGRSVEGESAAQEGPGAGGGSEGQDAGIALVPEAGDAAAPQFVHAKTRRREGSLAPESALFRRLTHRWTSRTGFPLSRESNHLC